MRRRILAAAVAACFIAPAYANPIGAQIVNGTAAINQAGNTLTVTNSPNAIINWQSFSINPAETTRFVQQSAASAVLNRVLGPDPSQLLGVLQSNGRVFLINPAGILVGQGAKIDVAGFVASTLNLSDADFLANKLNFGPSLNAGAIQNLGSITTPDGGTVYLVAPQVTNQGIITTPKGETILAAGNTVQLIDSGAPGVAVQITGSAGNATNLGQILADSGRIGMVAAAVKNSGTLSANSLVNQGGRIYLKATQAVTVDGAASISATGTTGGTIEVLGNQVILDGTATLDASGTNGGGTILVGGDAHGANPNVQNALNTFVGAGVTLKADGGLPSPAGGGLGWGNGGKVIVWADDTTLMYGHASARGGAQGGNGGFIETSGKRYLAVTNAADVGAPLGKGGIWLLDPQALTVIGAGWLGVGTPLGTTASPFTAAAALGPSTVTDTVLAAALALGGNVVLDTGAGVCAVAGACNITIDVTATGLGAINVPPVTGPGTTLTMNAADSIFINAPIATVTANPLNIVMNHGAAGAANLWASLALAAGTVNVGTYSTLGVVTPGVGTLNVTAGTTTLTGALTAANLNVSGGILNLNGVAATTLANLSLSGTGTLGGIGAVNVQGAAAPGTMTWTGGTLAGTGILTLTGSTLNAPGLAACPTCLTTLTLNKPLVNAAGSTANFGSGTANGIVQINVGAGGSATNNLGATTSYDNVNVLDVGGAGAFTNAGTVYIGPVVQTTATPRAPATGGSTNIPFVNNGGTVYFADNLLFSGPVTLNGGSLIGATLFNATPVYTAPSYPLIDITGTLTITGGTTLLLDHIRFTTHGATTQGSIGGAASSVTMNQGADIEVSRTGSWTMNSASFSLAPAATLSGFYNLGGAVTVPALGSAAFNTGVSFMNAGTLTQAGTLTIATAVNAGVMDLVATPVVSHLINNGTLNVLAGQTATISGDVMNNAPGIININGTANFQRELFNNGTINLNSGTINLPNRLVNLGTGIVNATGTLAAPSVFNGNGVNAVGGYLPGFTSPDFINAGTLNINGVMNVNGVFSQDQGGTVKGALGALGAATDVLNIATTGIELKGTGVNTLDNVTVNISAAGTTFMFPSTVLTMQNGAKINNAGTWHMFDGTTINAGAGAAPLFTNTGIIDSIAVNLALLTPQDLAGTPPSVLAAIGTPATIAVPLANNGSLNVLSGTLNLNGAYSGAGAITIDGYLSVLNTNVPVTTPSLSLTSGGTLGGAGVLTIPAGGVMNMLSPSSTAVTLNGKMLVNNGTVNQGTTTAYTDLWMTNGAIVNNNGIWNVGYYTYIVDMGGVTPSVFNNAGTLNINAGPLSSYISTVFNNTGTVNVNALTYMAGSGSLGGVFNIGTQTLSLGGLTTGYTLADGVQFNGTTGSISNTGVLNVAGVATINLTGGLVPALSNTNTGTINLIDPLAPAASSSLNLAGAGAILSNSGTITSSGLVGGRSLSATITQAATGVINVNYPLTLNGVNYPAGTVITAATVVVPPAGAPVVPPPVQQVIQQQAATVTTATTTATAPPPTITPLVIINPIFITAPDPNMPMLVGPAGGTIGGEPGTFGGPETTEDKGEKEIGSEKPASC